jgi:hypothetical protein
MDSMPESEKMASQESEEVLTPESEHVLAPVSLPPGSETMVPESEKMASQESEEVLTPESEGVLVPDSLPPGAETMVPDLLPPGAVQCARCNVIHADREAWMRSHSMLYPCVRCGLIHLDYWIHSSTGRDDFDCAAALAVKREMNEDVKPE